MEKRYYKIVDGTRVFNNGIITLNGATIFNPSEEQLLAAGYQALTEEELNEIALNNEINDLKDSLASEDYKIIKCAEAFIEGKELPYDINNLVIERDKKRTRINEIEEILK